MIKTYISHISSDIKKKSCKKILFKYSNISKYLRELVNKYNIEPHEMVFGKTMFDDDLHEKEESNYMTSLLLQNLSEKIGSEYVEERIKKFETKIIVDVEKWGYTKGDEIVKSKVYLSDVIKSN